MKNGKHAAAPQPTLPATITAKQFAEMVGLPDARRVRELAAAGILEKAGKDAYLIGSVAAYCDHLRTDQNSSEDHRFKKARAHLYEMRAREHEQRARLIEGTSHDADAIIFHMGQAVASCRAQILAMPNALSATVADLNTAAACHDVLSEACRETAQALSDYDPGTVHRRYLDSTNTQTAPTTNEE